MSLTTEYQQAERALEIARLRRLVTLRAMAAEGLTQQRISEQLGVSQSAVSQQLKASRIEVSNADPAVLLDAAAPVLRHIAAERGFTKLAVFGSVARGEATADSDVDLLVEPPAGTTITDLLSLQTTYSDVLCRDVDLVSYGGLSNALDGDIRRETVPL